MKSTYLSLLSIVALSSLAACSSESTSPTSDLDAATADAASLSNEDASTADNTDGATPASDASASITAGCTLTIDGKEYVGNTAYNSATYNMTTKALGFICQHDDGTTLRQLSSGLQNVTGTGVFSGTGSTTYEEGPSAGPATKFTVSNLVISFSELSETVVAGTHSLTATETAAGTHQISCKYRFSK